MIPEVQSSKKYLVLKPHEASFSDIFSVFLSDDIESKDFIESSQVKQTIIERRGILFLSLLLQKLLHYNAKLMSFFNSGLSTSLNVLANKNKFTLFLKNILRGRVVIPDRESAHFLSLIGLLDCRVELDNNIKPGSDKYFPSLSAMASKLAYENNEFIKMTVEKIWKMKLLGAYNFWNERNQANTTECFIFHDTNTDPDTIVVAFRGTEPFNTDDWCTDFDISWCKLNGINGRVHDGFMKALGLKLDGTWPNSVNDCDNQHAYNAITEVLKGHFKANTRTKFIVTGHSLGGALAVLFPAVLALHEETDILERLKGVYTFGQPRVGDEKFGKFMKEQFDHYGIKYYRFVYSHDIVPRIPFDDSALMFKHFGTCIYVNTLYEATVVEEEPSKNYFDFSSVVTSRTDALWELVRSFLLPRMFGPDYWEGYMLRTFRMIGLIFPGLPAHGPQEYINATRLADY